MENDHQLTTRAIDLFAPSDRFASTSRLYGRLHRYQLLLGRFWWVMALILVFVLGPVYLVTRELPAAYTSKARLWLTGRLNINEGRLYTEELIDYLSTQAELLRSSTIQQRALARLRAQSPDLFLAATAARRPRGFAPVRRLSAFLKSLEVPAATGTNAAEAAAPFSLKVTEGSKTSTLDLWASGPDAAATRAYLNCVLETYFLFKKEAREKASDQALTSVNGDVRQLAEQLKAQQARLHDFQSSNNVVFLQEQGSSAASYLAQLNRRISTLRTQLELLERLDPDQWIDVESRRAAGNAEEPADNSAKDALTGLAGPQGDLFRARQQEQLLKAKRDELSRFLRPAHPKIVKLNEEIATQDKLVEISREEARRQLTNRRQALQLEIQNLESAFNEWDPKAIASSRKIADYESMRLDLQRLQAAYDHVFGLKQTVGLGKTMDQENVGVLEPPSLARRVPRMAINLLVAVLAACGLSFTCLYGLARFDDRFASLTELSNHLSEEVLGQVPAISLKEAREGTGIQSLERQRFEFLESFRNIRSSLLYAGQGGPRPKTVLITSSVPREGKSTVALYLAATMAMGRSRVLLIDGDMRQSSLHKFFAVDSGPGLAEILGHEASAGGAVVTSGLENLSLLPAGRPKRNPGELVLSSEWGRLTTELYPEFDYILIDSPPLLATDDAACLAPQVDAVVMVVRASFTSARMARRALNVLRQRHARVLGLVFNRVRSSPYEYHCYQHYRNGYQWRQEPSVAALVAGASATARTNRSQAN